MHERKILVNKTLKYIESLFKIIEVYSNEYNEISNYVMDINKYTIQVDDDDLNDNLKPGDILIYNLFCDFSLFIKDQINNNTISENILHDFNKIISNMYDTDDPEIIDIVNTCVFEIIIDSELCEKTIKKLLKGKMLENYIKLINH